MGEVIDILNKRPHYDGPVKCMGCGHSWHAVWPVEEAPMSLGLECPECGLCKGVTEGLCMPGPSKGPVYRCAACGCEVFYVLVAGSIVCPGCGSEAILAELVDD